ncbi:M23 family metallopeptidase [Rubrivivax albus]|uniref:M23 family metallopeptidase n=1 Tax=Rubrivivax albus TaxID=2499835 RepID=A0A3S2URL1_9BURK|nr:M23 family metallopeptidase [Rubrivivax albus]
MLFGPDSSGLTPLRPDLAAPLTHRLQRHAQQALAWHRAHQKLVHGSVLAGLVGFSALAFGVAPLAPDASALPQRLVTEEIVPEGLQAQLEALETLELDLTRADLTRSSDTPQGLLARLGVVDDEAAAFLRKDPTARRLFQGRAGKMVQVTTNDAGALTQLVARYPAERSQDMLTHFTRLTVEKVADQWLARLDTAPLETQVRLGSGTITSSLFVAADEARIPDPISIQIAEVFSNEIDFHRELRQGDTFSVVYESLTADGEPITWNSGTGRVLAAEFVNAGKAYHAVWFPDAGNGKGGYFALDGSSKQRTFLTSPMAFSRVSSGFAMRFHPILKKWRAHKGIDYAAPRGTPIRTVGAGVVEFAGWQNGYGKAVEIRHGNGKSTFYAHMNRIDVRKGQRVDQGDNIGQVGSTGWSTGPHLHFEFRVNGNHQDPRKLLKSGETVQLAAALRPRFEQVAQGVKTQLRIAESMRGVIVDAE